MISSFHKLFVLFILGMFSFISQVAYAQHQDSVANEARKLTLPEFLQHYHAKCLLDRISESSLYALDTVKFGKEDIEIRLWEDHGSSEDCVEGYQIKRIDGEWTGIHVMRITYFLGSFGKLFGIGRTAENRLASPKMGWKAFTGYLDNNDISSLPNGLDLKLHNVVLDGVVYFVEVRVGASYRWYLYGNPQIAETPEQKKMCNIVELFEKELK
jgi:hypothetical protein